MKKGYVADIEKLSLENENFRKVLYTDKNCQLVLMSLLPGEAIGEEVHDVDQFLRVEKGAGKATTHPVEPLNLTRNPPPQGIWVPLGNKSSLDI